MSQLWETHTVVAKSSQTLPNVGIQRIEFYLGMFLDALLSSRSSLTRACQPASAWCVVSSMSTPDTRVRRG